MLTSVRMLAFSCSHLVSSFFLPFVIGHLVFVWICDLSEAWIYELVEMRSYIASTLGFQSHFRALVYD